MSASPHCVLIVDDDPDAIILCRRLINKIAPSAVICAARNVAEATEYLLRATGPSGDTTPLPTTVLLDLDMPPTNGFDLLRWIRQNQSLAAVKVVVLSNSESLADARRALELGAQGYFVKFPSWYTLGSVLVDESRSSSPFVSQTEDIGSIHGVDVSDVLRLGSDKPRVVAIENFEPGTAVSARYP